MSECGSKLFFFLIGVILFTDVETLVSNTLLTSITLVSTSFLNDVVV